MSQLLQVNVPVHGLNKSAQEQHPKKRAKAFEQNLKEYRMSLNHQRIPDEDELGDSKSYLIQTKGLKGLNPPPLLKRPGDWDKFSGQFLFSLMYDNPQENLKFFFGRSCRSQPR